MIVESASHPRGSGSFCRDQIEKIGLWREDGLDPEEVHEMIWDEGERLVAGFSG